MMSSNEEPTSTFVGDPKFPRRSSLAAATPLVEACAARSCMDEVECEADVEDDGSFSKGGIGSRRADLRLS